MTDIEWARLLATSAYAAWSSQLISSEVSMPHERFKWFKTFKPGDLVMETTTFWVPKYDEYRLGHLISDQQEPMFTDEKWEEVKDDYAPDPRPTERIIRIKTLVHGTPFRWENADFIRVPESIRDFPGFDRAVEGEPK